LHINLASPPVVASEQLQTYHFRDSALIVQAPSGGSENELFARLPKSVYNNADWKASLSWKVLSIKPRHTL